MYSIIILYVPVTGWLFHDEKNLTIPTTAAKLIKLIQWTRFSGIYMTPNSLNHQILDRNVYIVGIHITMIVFLTILYSKFVSHMMLWGHIALKVFHDNILSSKIHTHGQSLINLIPQNIF